MSRSPSQADSSGLPGVRSTLQARGFSPAAENFYLRSWRTSTQTQYRSYLHKWEKFCCERHKNPLSASLACGINFIADMEAKNHSYSAVNMARSALSAFLPSFGQYSFGAHPDLVRLMKAIYAAKPPEPKYKHIWDISVVLSYCENLGPSQDLTLKKLSFRLTMLSGQCCQTLQALDITHTKRVGSECVFMLNC